MVNNSSTSTSTFVTNPTVIYGLFDPSGQLMYVGQTVQGLMSRLYNHTSDARCERSNAPVHGWIRQLQLNGKEPLIRALPFTDEQEAIDHYGLGSLLNEINAGTGDKADTSWRTEENIAQLGTRPDTELADKWDVSTRTLRRERKRRGIPSYRSRRADDRPPTGPHGESM